MPRRLGLSASLLLAVRTSFIWSFMASAMSTNDGRRKIDAVEETNHYDFIFGYSTGHVGTTTLSEGKYYGRPHDVVFIHEMHYGKYNISRKDIFTTQKWAKATYEDEYSYVKDIYMPFMVKSKGSKKTLLDLGHNSLYFIKALLAYLQSETSFKFVFVRIRRERIESAISLAYKHPVRTA